MNSDDIAMVIDEFGYASRRAMEAGYDGVQIHAAHGYLLSTFLSPHANKRDDQWGGSKENRFRIVSRTLKKVKETAGKDFPVLIKLNTYERAVRGIKAEDCIGFAEMVAETGCCDAIEFSSGTVVAADTRPIQCYKYQASTPT